MSETKLIHGGVCAGRCRSPRKVLTARFMRCHCATCRKWAGSMLAMGTAAVLVLLAHQTLLVTTRLNGPSVASAELRSNLFQLKDRATTLRV